MPEGRQIRLKRLTDLDNGASPSTSSAIVVRASPVSFLS